MTKRKGQAARDLKETSKRIDGILNDLAEAEAEKVSQLNVAWHPKYASIESQIESLCSPKNRDNEFELINVHFRGNVKSPGWFGGHRFDPDADVTWELEKNDGTTKTTLYVVLNLAVSQLYWQIKQEDIKTGRIDVASNSSENRGVTFVQAAKNPSTLKEAVKKIGASGRVRTCVPRI